MKSPADNAPDSVSRAAQGTPRARESVWDYPRPPRLEPSTRRVRVVLAGRVIAETKRALRVLETSHPPVYYIPPADVAPGVLTPNPRRTWCEFKGEAAYYDVVAGGEVAAAAAWYYPAPRPGYEGLEGTVAFYPGRMDACYLDDELVTPQEGDFYGGWITSEIAGPFKGAPGTRGW
jgi:uncharacterized protein (DUF427 family)